MKKKSNRKKSI